ncbi:hypothetical protein Q7C36_003211 [Tachysurus vachellii]|uniref:Uncharacterized protein n=1 Tax=Tachysurus vachellii TaxID=175792 RepID=A0AA88T4T5_TACVA|nr:hypothetical protein Q7C36_003211 [Tachysurus vachellii]
MFSGVRVCLVRRRAEVDSTVIRDMPERERFAPVSLARTVRGYFNSGSAPPLSLSCARRLTSVGVGRLYEPMGLCTLHSAELQLTWTCFFTPDPSRYSMALPQSEVLSVAVHAEGVCFSSA